MSSFRRTLSDAPAGIGSEMLSRINALFIQPPQQDTSVPQDVAQGSLTASNHEETPSAVSPQERKPHVEQMKLAEQEDEGIWEERTPPTSPPPKIVARYSYPSERRPRRRRGRLSIDRPSPLPAPPTPPLQPSLSSRFTSYIGSYFSSEPAIIEYSDHEIARNSTIRIVAKRIGYPSSVDDKKVVRVMAMVVTGVDANGEMRAKPIELTAKHKRVREILKQEGARCIAEEVYADEVRDAFRRLKGA